MKGKRFNNYYIIDNVAYIEIIRRNGEKLVTEIDLEYLDKIINFGSKWNVSWFPKRKSYYVTCSKYLGKVNGKFRSRTFYLHKLILENIDEDIDHVDNNTLNNKKNNLRPVNRSVNMMNRSGINSNNKSGFRNVSWNKSENKWSVQLQVDGKNKVLGMFKYDELEKAGAFAEKMRREIYGKFLDNNEKFS